MGISQVKFQRTCRTDMFEWNSQGEKSGGKYTKCTFENHFYISSHKVLILCIQINTVKY